MANSLVKFAALGGAAYLGYEWWKNNQAAAAPPSTSGTPAPGASAGSGSGAPAAGSNAPGSATKYSGPSLDQMFTALVSAVKLGMKGGDTAVGCPGGVSGLGVVRRAGGGATGTTADPRRSPSDIAGGPTGRGSGLAPRLLPSTDCSTPLATPDVWGWYLVNRAGVGVSAAPSPADAFPGADLSVPITAAQYWAGAAPLLRTQLGMAGLGFFAGSFRRSGRGLYVGPRGLRGIGDFQGPPLIDPTGALVDTTAADYEALKASAAAGGFDTSAGSYSMNPDTGAVNFTPVRVPQSKPLLSGVSNGVLALAGGALVLFVGVAAGGRR